MLTIHGNPREQSHGNQRDGGLGWIGDKLIWNGVGWNKKKKIALDWGGNGLDSCPLAGLHQLHQNMELLKITRHATD